MDPADVPLTPDGATVYDTGGVIMSVTWQFGRRDEPVHLDHAVAATSIAPLLTVLPTPARTTELEFRDPAGTRVRHFTVAAAPPPLAPPAIAKVTSTAPSQKSLALPRPGMPSMTAVFDLAGPPPADAYALIVYDASKTARSWFAVSTDRTSYTVVTGGKGCYGSTVSPMWQGETLRFAWLDRGGRLSAMSKPLVIRKP